MNLRKPSSRWALWVFAAALLLKSAMPFLASASAELQGKTLVEVCTVYGVSLVPLGDGHRPGSDHAPDHVAGHGNDHCALTALSALGTSEPPLFVAAPLAASDTSPPLAQPSPQAPDACATWVARLKHGPPRVA